MSETFHIEIMVIAENSENGDRYSILEESYGGKHLTREGIDSVFELACELLKRELAPADWVRNAESKKDLQDDELTTAQGITPRPR